ncbi:MAG: hypothetical protein DHS20C19_02270 [Acidimicrobiales bacterium]|nr:MAG: hypothetical protein DHS20C19_02270 [Acidimicrobiales bacterium]
MLDEAVTETQSTAGTQPTVAITCGVLGVLGAVWAFWLVLPAVIFGLAAVVLGVRVRRRGDREAGSVAVTLGVVALLVLPSVFFVVDSESDYVRNCTLNPTDSDC